MFGQPGWRRCLRYLAIPVALLASLSYATGEKRDPMIQERVYDHLDRMDAAVSFGNKAEAVACAEMVLLKRDITVYVDDSEVPASLKDVASRAIQNAATNWEDSLQSGINIRFVPRFAADVIVKYAGNVKYEGNEAAGTVRWSRGVLDLGSGQYDYKVTASITLRTHTPNGSMMNYSQMLHTAGHELGHVLGLEDTSKVGDLMGPLKLNKPVERATRHEIDSLNEVRQRAEIVLNRITDSGDGIAEALAEESRAQVLSGPVKSIELHETHRRITVDGRFDTPVRSAVRDRKAPKRTKKSAFSGLAG